MAFENEITKIQIVSEEMEISVDSLIHKIIQKKIKLWTFESGKAEQINERDLIDAHARGEQKIDLNEYRLPPWGRTFHLDPPHIPNFRNFSDLFITNNDVSIIKSDTLKNKLTEIKESDLGSPTSTPSGLNSPWIDAAKELLQGSTRLRKANGKVCFSDLSRELIKKKKQFPGLQEQTKSFDKLRRLLAKYAALLDPSKK
jgi:hypothetical protein